MIGHEDDMTCHDIETENTTATIPARDSKDIANYSREEMEAAAIDELTAEYAGYFNDPNGARDVVLGLVSEFGLNLAFDCIREVGARASPKKPQVPSAYIREMCRNRSCG